MSDRPEPEGWNGGLRSDGMRIVKPADQEFYVIAPHDGRPRIATCLCCKLPFETERAAKLVANAVYPPRQAGSDA